MLYGSRVRPDRSLYGVRGVRSAKEAREAMSKRNQVALRAVLDASDTTSAFLQDVISVLESFFAEMEDSECPEGFSALDTAVQAFEAAEEE